MRIERLVGLMLMLGLLGCGPEAILVAHPYDADLEDADGQVDAGNDAALPSFNDASAASDAGNAGDAGGCSGIKDCPFGTFCSKPHCGPDARGTCATRPRACDGDLSAVCGCDGITYFNDCLRKQNLVPSSTRGECESGPTCTPLTGCPVRDALCYVRGDFAEKPCSNSGISLGKCWVVPDICQADRSGGDALQRCGPSGPEGPCMNSCEAIKSGAPVTRGLFCSHGPQGMSPAP